MQYLEEEVLNSSLEDHSDTYILFKRTITVVGVRADEAARVADWNSK